MPSPNAAFIPSSPRLPGLPHDAVLPRFDGRFLALRWQESPMGYAVCAEMTFEEFRSSVLADYAWLDVRLPITAEQVARFLTFAYDHQRAGISAGHDGPLHFAYRSTDGRIVHQDAT